MKRAPILLLASWIGVSAVAAIAQPVVEGRRMLSLQGERYGLLPADDARVQRTRAVFDRIVRAAGRRPGLALDVEVLDTPRVIGQALPGGPIVLSRGLLEVTGRDDDALAFVIGHEVAHLARDHHAALRLTGDAAGVSPEQAALHRDNELEADRLGALFAALAGYQPTRGIGVLERIGTDATADALHPGPRARAAAITRQLAEVSAQIEILHLGLFLLGMGQALDAARVLDHFLAVFPSREALSVAGVAWHNEALHHHAPASPFHHLRVVDGSSRALRLRSSQGFLHKPTPPPPQFVRAMDRALTLYKQAVEADPTYAPALNNLATAYLDLDETDLAAAYANRAVKADPALGSAYNSRGITRALAGDRRGAEDDFHRALALEPGRREILDNLALVQVGRDGGKGRRPRPPALDRTVHSPHSVDGLAPGMPLERARPRLGEPGLRTLAVPLGGRRDEDVALHIAPSAGRLVSVRHDAIDAVAAFGAARAVTREGVGPGDSLASVERAYGRPAAVDGVQALNAWYYPSRGLAIFAVGDRVHAIWAGRPAR